MTARRVALAAALLAAGAAVGWALRSAGEGGAEPELASLREELDAARAERERAEEAAARAARRRRADARDARRAAVLDPEPTAAAPAAAEAPGDPETDDWRARVAAYPLLRYEGAPPAVRDAIAGVDWTVVAENVAAMAPVADEIATALARGERPSAEAVGASQRHNGPLVTIAMKLHANGIPGTGANGAFTHPAVVTNVLLATLEAAGLPASEAQVAEVERIGDDFLLRETARAAGYTGDEIELRRLADEAELKRALFEALMAVLTDEQREALCPVASRGRVATDLFSEGVLWVGRVQPLAHRDDDHLAELVAARLLRDVELESREREIVRAWVDTLPLELRTAEADPLDRMGMVEARRATECARHVVRLLESLLRELPPEDERVARLRRLGGTVVPFRAPRE